MIQHLSIFVNPFNLILVQYFCSLANSLSCSSLLTGWVLDAHEGIDFRGSDISYELMDDPDMCQWKCTEDPNCQFYTYVNESFFDRNYW